MSSAAEPWYPKVETELATSSKQPQAKRKKGKKCAWAEVEAVVSSASGPWSQHRDWYNARQNSVVNNSKRWSHQHSGQERWDTKASEKAWWSSQRWGKPTAKPHQADRRRVPNGSAKPQCQFFIGVEEEAEFRVTRRVLGPHGQHVKEIFEMSGAKLRLRGRGSGFLEGPEQQESTDELMLCVSAPDAEGYAEAVRLVSELLEKVYEEYRTFCQAKNWAAPELEVVMHEGPRSGAR